MLHESLGGFAHVDSFTLFFLHFGTKVLLETAGEYFASTCCNLLFPDLPNHSHLASPRLQRTPQRGAFSRQTETSHPGNCCQVHNWAQAVSSAEASGASAVVVFNDLDAQVGMVGQVDSFQLGADASKRT